jgi:hypothetical protein
MIEKARRTFPSVCSGFIISEIDRFDWMASLDNYGIDDIEDGLAISACHRRCQFWRIQNFQCTPINAPNGPADQIANVLLDQDRNSSQMTECK